MDLINIVIELLPHLLEELLKAITDRKMTQSEKSNLLRENLWAAVEVDRIVRLQQAQEL